MAIQLLTDQKVKTAKPGDKPLRMSDGGGLYLLIQVSGAKWWRLDYTVGGKRKTLSLGVYPAVTLANARRRSEDAQEMVANGTDPSDTRKQAKATQKKEQEAERRIEAGEPAIDSFEELAREWYAKYSLNWAEHHGDRIIRRFERDIFPWIGGRPIADVSAPELLNVIRRIESRGALETAHRALGNCGQVFRYAVATGRAVRDPSGDLRGALPPPKGEHFAAVTEPKQVAELLRTLDGYQGTLTVACALRLAPLVFVRPGELRNALWADIDLEAGEWRYTVTKTNTPHIVPLASQAVATLRELHALTGSGRFVFPGARTNGRPMSDNAILAAMRRMGIGKDEMSGHGFRAMARTILDEVLGFRPDLIEHQLAHAVKDPNGRAYNRTAHLPERRKMMQAWADYLDKLKVGADVFSIHKEVVNG